MFVKYVLYLSVFYVNVKATPWQYRIPTPSINVYIPRGLDISIPDTCGVELVIFYVNVSENLEGEETRYIGHVEKKVNGKWTYDISDVQFKRGYNIYYNVYVQRYRKGYLYTGPTYVVEELKTRRISYDESPEVCDEQTFNFNSDSSTSERTNSITSSTPNYQINGDSASTQETNSPTTETSPIKNSTLNECHDALSTTIRVWGETQMELKNAKADLEILKEIASAQPLYLQLRGTAIQVGKPKEVVQFVLLEKLRTNLKVKQAWVNGSEITFELFTLEQKLDVLKRAKKYLQDSKNIIISV